jgi:hypothetical protein
MKPFLVMSKVLLFTNDFITINLWHVTIEFYQLLIVGMYLNDLIFEGVCKLKCPFLEIVVLFF